MSGVAYSKDIAEKICEQIATTTLSIKSICKLDGMPHHATIFDWRKAHKEFDAMYLAAKKRQIETMAEEILDIVDDGSNDLMTIVKGSEIYEIENKEVTNRSRIRYDVRRWLLSKLAPEKYGDKVTVDSNVKMEITGMEIK